MYLRDELFSSKLFTFVTQNIIMWYESKVELMKNVVITGSARGFGLKLAHEFLKNNCNANVVTVGIYFFITISKMEIFI